MIISLLFFIRSCALASIYISGYVHTQCSEHINNDLVGFNQVYRFNGEQIIMSMVENLVKVITDNSLADQLDRTSLFCLSPAQ